MLALRPHTSIRSIRRREAFTLLEVLVVVAILVVLASVASIYVFKYLDDAKKDKALMDMKALDGTMKAYMLKNDIDDPSQVNLTDLAPLMEQGTAALVDPWGNPYQMRAMAAEQAVRVQFFTFAKDGTELAWPRK